MTKQFEMSKYINTEEMYKAKSEYLESKLEKVNLALKDIIFKTPRTREEIYLALDLIKIIKSEDNETNKTTD